MIMPYQGVYPAEDVCAYGDEISSTYEGRHVTLYGDNISHGSQVDYVTKGYGVWFEDAVGMPFTTQTAALGNLLMTIDTEGIWCVDVEAVTDGPANEAVEPGDRLYINTTTGLVSKVSAAATQLPFGYALGNVTSAALSKIAVKVHWDPVWAAALKVRGTPGAGITFCSVGHAAYPLTYAITGDVASELYANYTLGEGLFRGLYIEVANTAVATVASLYGARIVADVEAATTMTDGNMHAVHGYARVYGELNGPGDGGVRISGIKGEVYSTGATITAVDYIAGVISFCTLTDAVTAGTYTAYLAYCAEGGHPADSVLHVDGWFTNAFNLYAWSTAGGNLFVLREGRGCLAATIAPGAAVGRIPITISGVQFYIPVWN